jgi:hypothetical protein
MAEDSRRNLLFLSSDEGSICIKRLRVIDLSYHTATEENPHGRGHFASAPEGAHGRHW